LKGEAVIATDKNKEHATISRKKKKKKRIPEFLKDIIKVRLDRLQHARVSSNVAGNLRKAVLREVVEMRQHRIAVLQPSQSETHFQSINESKDRTHTRTQLLHNSESGLRHAHGVLHVVKGVKVTGTD